MLEQISRDKLNHRPRKSLGFKTPHEVFLIPHNDLQKLHLRLKFTVYTMPFICMLLERLKSDKALRQICGWEHPYQVPDESIFSRAYAEFAARCLPERVHAALIQTSYKGAIVGHISRDSTAINAREKPARGSPAKPGRSKKGEERPKVMIRLER